MKAKYPTIVAALALAIGLALPRPAAAQQGKKAQATGSVKVTNALLTKFVTVYPEVSRIETRMRQKMASAGKGAKSRKIQMQAQQEIRQLFKENDMTMVKYEAVVRKLNADPAMMKKFQAMLAAKTDSSGGGGGGSN